MKPLIGITTGEIFNLADPWSPVTYGQSHTYSDAIIRAGGVPILIPITNDASVLKQLYKKLDGLLFAGGNDVEPGQYGEEAGVYTIDASVKRDTTEILLMRWALGDKKATLAICRGMQLLNVVCGGTLYQHILAGVKNAEEHSLSTLKKNREYIAHHLKVDKASKLAKIIASDKIDANSHHHQAIKVLAGNLKATAWSADKIIEAVESEGSEYLLGIQCHPEALHKVEPKWDLLFKSFIESSMNLKPM